jgi:DNA-binding transcriptional MerR regulator
MFTSGEVATELRIPRWKLLYLIETGQLPPPSLTVPGRRLFTLEDLGRLRTALAMRADRCAAPSTAP